MPTATPTTSNYNLTMENLEQRRLLSGGTSAIVTQHNLVSDGFVAADHTDANLKNPWGVAFGPGGALWVSDNNSGLSTLYDGTGAPQSLVVTVPGGGGGTVAAPPDGKVINRPLTGTRCPLAYMHWI